MTWLSALRTVAPWAPRRYDDRRFREVGYARMGTEMSAAVIDLRSDVVAPPTDEMWEAMRSAEFGWAPRGEDPSVEEIERLGAALLGKEACLFVPTCSVANLLALMTLGRRGTRVILESTSHILTAEEGGFASICGLVPLSIDGRSGVLTAESLVKALDGEDFGHGMQTSLICLENSHNNAGGIAMTPEQTATIVEVARTHGVPVHLDGARLLNTAVALGREASELTEGVNTVAISLNKGLSAPAGALLCGRRETIDEARVNLRRIGVGSLHKAGIWAAAGLVALRTMIPQLAHDNRRAARLAEELVQIPGLHIDLDTVQTNIILADVAGMNATDFAARLAERGVLVLARSQTTVRFVVHRLVGDTELERTREAIAVEMRVVR